MATLLKHELVTKYGSPPRFILAEDGIEMVKMMLASKASYESGNVVSQEEEIIQQKHPNQPSIKAFVKPLKTANIAPTMKVDIVASASCFRSSYANLFSDSSADEEAPRTKSAYSSMPSSQHSGYCDPSKNNNNTRSVNKNSSLYRNSSNICLNRSSSFHGVSTTTSTVHVSSSASSSQHSLSNQPTSSSCALTDKKMYFWYLANIDTRVDSQNKASVDFCGKVQQTYIPLCPHLTVIFP
jgi:hypothetical protein